jgi:hypothetical protein
MPHFALKAVLSIEQATVMELRLHQAGGNEENIPPSERQLFKEMI